MHKPLSRRQFMAHGAPAGIGLATATLVLGTTSGEAQEPAKPAPKKKDRPPRLDPDMVRDFVAAAHGNLDKVKALLEQQPKLVNACWDWGGGDWETGLGGAAHMGNRAIALFLLEKGARLDVFAAAMLGKLEIVKAAVTLFPGIEKVPGPHGIPLLAHAKAGKEYSAEVLKYLESLKQA